MVEKSIVIFIVAMTLVFFMVLVLATKFNTAAVNAKDEAKSKCRLQENVIALTDDNMNYSMELAERFPYVAAVITHSTDTIWSFRCFASLILGKWIVTAAQCRSRLPGHTHRAVLYHDYAHNLTHTFPILFWRIHEKFNKSSFTPKYDIAVAKLNIENYPFQLRPSVIDESIATEVEASVWKTVATMDKKLYLTNQFDKYDLKIGNAGRCFESYGVEIDDALICVDMTQFEDCFTHDFGPIYSGDKLVGLVLIKPLDCDMKLSVFTNISYHTSWILKTTRDS